MLNRKNAKRNAHNRKKASVLLICLVVLLCVSVLSTLAYLVVTSDPIMNIFKPASVTPSVEEDDFDGSVKSNVYLTNNGTTNAYIRAAIVVTWQDKDGGVHPIQPVVGEDYEITMYDSGWFQADDGFYYHTAPVAPGGETAILIKSCVPNVDATPAGYGLNVEIIGSAIQSDPANAVEVWGITAAEISKGGTAE